MSDETQGLIAVVRDSAKKVGFNAHIRHVRLRQQINKCGIPQQQLLLVCLAVLLGERVLVVNNDPMSIYLVPHEWSIRGQIL